jgi:hypothetical protein
VPGCRQLAGAGTEHDGTGNCQRHEGWVLLDALHTSIGGQLLPPENAKVVALAGAVLLGRYRRNIAASAAPLQASLEVLDEQLGDYVERVRRQLGTGAV